MPQRSRRHWLLGCLAASSLAAPCPIAAATDESAVALEEIVVTARKREESLLDTPVAVTAFTGDALAKQHVDRLDGIATATPNVVFDAGGTFSGTSTSASVYIRGIGQIDFTPTTEPGVGIYLDGVYMSQAMGSVLELVDIERVEVLRGPQGTLFGRNTIGGAINVTTRQPDERLHGEARITTGAYDRIDVRASVNLPLTSTLYAKLAAASHNRDGFVSAPNAPASDELGDVNRDASRAALRFAPSERFEILASADYTRQREDGVPHVLVGTFEGVSLANIAALADPTSPSFLPPPAPLPAPSFIDLHNLLATTPIGVNGGIAGVTPGVVPNPLFGRPTIGSADTVDIDSDNLVNLSNHDLSSESDIWGLALTLSYDPGWAILKSITSYREAEVHSGIDNDTNEVVIGQIANDLESDQLSQELQLSGLVFNNRLNWVVGLYHLEEDALHVDDVHFSPVHLLSGARVDNRSTAAFAQVTFNLTPRLAVTGGLRYSDEEKKFIVPDTCYPLPAGPVTRFDGTTVSCMPLHTIIDPKFLNAGFLAFVNPPGRLCCLPISDAQGNVVALLPGLLPGTELLPRGTTEQSFNDLTPHASIAYRWTDDLMTYFSYSEGFKSGGFVQRVFPPRTAPPAFDPETAKVFEIGAKWSGFANRVRASAAAFHTEYDDLHVQINDGIAPITRNAAGAEIDGVELEVTALPAAGWLIQASVGYLDAGYSELDEREDFATDILAITLDSELVNAPEWTTSLAVEYGHRFRHGAEVVARVDWAYRSEMYKDALNFPQLRENGYHLVDLAVTYVSADNTWEISAFGKNVTDERYLVSGFANALSAGWALNILGRPAEWGLSFRYRFDR